MNLLDLPDDKLFEICELLDFRDLQRFVKTSKRIEYICGGILLKKEEERNKILDDHYERVIDVDISYMEKLYKGDFIRVRLSLEYISQRLPKSHSDVPWPLPKYKNEIYEEYEYMQTYPVQKLMIDRTVYFEEPLDELQLAEVVNILADQGYY